MRTHRSSSVRERVVPFTAGDGFQCRLINVRGKEPPTKGPVLLVHGSGVRSNIFRAPVETTFVDYLVEHRYDVWLEDWRASIDLLPNQWTLDQAALYDHPKAVEKVVQETGYDTVKAVIHCQGSTSFMMAAAAGLVPQVKTIVSNAVSLHPVVPRWSWLKLTFLLPILGLMTEGINPQWDAGADHQVGRLMYHLGEMFHRECDNSVCHQVSFCYGALWRHENLNEDTHEWLRTEFAHCPMTFYRQIARCVHHGSLVPFDKGQELPGDFGVGAPQTDARFALFAGQDNLCFLPESQAKTHRFLSRTRHRVDTLHIVPHYGHLDMFMGQRAARDVFPVMLNELDKQT